MFLTLGALAVTLLSGVPAVYPVPEAGPPQATERVETPVDDPAIPGDVVESVVRLRYPLPVGSSRHPEACDWIAYLRWRHEDGPRDSAAADAVLTDMPGLSGGAGEQAQIGAQTVHLAAQRGRKVEFWALDRRSNCLEDRTGLDAANKAGDATLIAGNGPVQYAGPIGRVPKDAVRLPGYRHGDVIGAALKQNGGKLNRASTALTDFTLKRPTSPETLVPR